jgi:hypothetical protein
MLLMHRSQDLIVRRHSEQKLCLVRTRVATSASLRPFMILVRKGHGRILIQSIFKFLSQVNEPATRTTSQFAFQITQHFCRLNAAPQTIWHYRIYGYTPRTREFDVMQLSRFVQSWAKNCLYCRILSRLLSVAKWSQNVGPVPFHAAYRPHPFGTRLTHR